MSSSATAIESRLDLLRRQLAAAQEQHAETQRAVRAAERKEERAGSVVYSLREQLEMELLRSWGNQPDLKALLKKGGGGIFYEALSALAEVKGLHLWGEWCDTKEKVLRFGMNRGEIGAVARIADGIRYFAPAMKKREGGFAVFGVSHRDMEACAWELRYSVKTGQAHLVQLHYGHVEETLDFATLESALRHVEEHLWLESVIDQMPDVLEAPQT